MRLIDADALKNLPEFDLGVVAAGNIRNIIDKAPTVEERKHGHWINPKAWHVECSECHHVLEFICDVKKYCPNCGAKMDGE